MFSILSEEPFLVSLINTSINEGKIDYSERNRICKVLDHILLQQTIKTHQTFLLRGTGIEDLNQVLKYGVDVYPPDSPIYSSDDPCKAMEYGWDNANKIILLIYHSNMLKRSFIEISSDSAEKDISDLMLIYPTKELSVDGSTILLSKLRPDDNRRGTSYEFAYGYWIPGNPIEALFAVFLIGNFDNQEIKSIQETIDLH